jgi:uridine kinase
VVRTDDFASWENPLHWWSRLEEQVLQPVAAGHEGRYQRYDWQRRSLAAWHTVAPGGMLILEGVSSARAAVRDRLSLSVWVDTPRHIRLARGLARDGIEAESLWEQWMAEEDAHFGRERTREHADVIVCGV